MEPPRKVQQPQRPKRVSKRSRLPKTQQDSAKGSCSDEEADGLLTLKESPCLDVPYPTGEAVNDIPTETCRTHKETPGSKDAVESQAQIGLANEQCEVEQADVGESQGRPARQRRPPSLFTYMCMKHPVSITLL